jgi:hypothetical protein
MQKPSYEVVLTKEAKKALIRCFLKKRSISNVLMTKKNEISPHLSLPFVVQVEIQVQEDTP